MPFFMVLTADVSIHVGQRLLKASSMVMSVPSATSLRVSFSHSLLITTRLVLPLYTSCAAAGATVIRAIKAATIILFIGLILEDQ